MSWISLLFFCSAFKLSVGYQHAKPIHSSLTPDRCLPNSYRLNDCNWCHCKNTRYTCKARVCNEIDMFGHFNDAIQDLNVGMEGHGVWRNKQTVCEAGVQYQRDDLICICTEIGTWPNPICRDTFRILHNVVYNDLSKLDKPDKASKSRCEPTKLYLIGCNTCYCPESGQIDPNMCTKNDCDANDPILHLREDARKEPDGLEIYAECNVDTQYNLGCRNCTCLRNNRLVCSACSDGSESSQFESKCKDKVPNESFQLDCNMCSCDENESMYCTSKKCLDSEEKATIEVSKSTETNLRSSERPLDDTDCIPGTSFRKDCNKCFCYAFEDGKKTIGCTLKNCVNSTNALTIIKSDCVEGTVYKSKCLKCRCDLIDGEKRETCLTDSECSKANSKKPRDSKMWSLDGYCEPQHEYSWDCNNCRCLSDSETVVCTSKVCPTNQTTPITVDIIPVKQSKGKPCPKDHIYKIGCNLCFCLANGNILCTTKNC